MIDKITLLKICLKQPDLISEFLTEFDAETQKKLKYFQSLNKDITPEGARAFGVVLEDDLDTEIAYKELEQKKLDEFKAWATLSNNWDDVDKLVSKYKITYGDKTEGVATLDGLKSISSIYELYKQSVEEKVSSGFSNIDSTFKGGWARGSLYSILGLTGLGKSIFLANFARASWFNKQNVLYISTEMNELQVADRIIRSYSQQDTFEKALLYIQKYNTPKSICQVRKVHPYETTCDDIQKIIDNLNWEPDIIIIDYGDELKSSVKTQSEYDAQGFIYAGLKKLATVNDCPVITATQTNRGAEDTEKGGTKAFVGKSAMSDSSKKTRLVDGLMSIQQQNSDKQSNQLNLRVLKNRYGKDGQELYFNINYDTMRLSDNIVKIGKTKQETVAESTIIQEAKNKLSTDEYKYFYNLIDLDEYKQITELGDLFDSKKINRVQKKNIKNFLTAINNTRKIDFGDMEEENE